MTPEQAIQIFTDRKRAYQLVFGTEAGKAVLLDLGPFCRAKETCVVPGDRDRTAVLEGRREVFLFINDFLELSVEELIAKFTRPDPKGAISHDDRSDPYA